MKAHNQTRTQLARGRQQAQEAELQELILPNGNRAWFNRKLLEEDPHLMKMTLKFLGGSIKWVNP
jgi:hypothetical protein